MAASNISGFDIDGDVAAATSADETPETIEEELARRVISQLRQNHPKAAAAAAAELLRKISRDNDLGYAIID